MNRVDLLKKELTTELDNTKRILGAVSKNQFTYAPHDKSFTLLELSTHIASLPSMAEKALNHDSFDLSELSRPEIDSHHDLMKYFDQVRQDTLKAFDGVDDTDLDEQFTMTLKGKQITQQSKYWHVRTWAINHLIHHRGQLSVYLRLLDIPVPGMYGPSADEAR